MKWIEKFRRAVARAIQDPVVQRGWLLLLTAGCVVTAVLGYLAVNDRLGGFSGLGRYRRARTLLPISFFLGSYAHRHGRNLARRGYLWMEPARYEIAFTPEQGRLLKYGSEDMKAHRFHAAEKAIAQALSSISDRKSDSVRRIVEGLVCVQLEQDKISAAELLCDEYLQSEASDDFKVGFADCVACMILSKASSPWLRQAERLVRRALELKPDSLTVKGTLGSLLAEQGNFEAAEPLLRECLGHSPAEHDKAISSFYLGLVLRSRGDIEKGNAMIVEALAKLPRSWLDEKARLRCPEVLKAP
jgi:tetratricopeptide (TPR) repeat protein